MKCFFVEPTDKAKLSLRRYCGDKCEENPQKYHDAMTYIKVVGVDVNGGGAWKGRAPAKPFADDDPRWPKACICGREFIATDPRQLFFDRIYVNKADGTEHSIRSRTPGMMWDAYWMPSVFKGSDGRSLVVITPDGWEWMIDGQASNCTRPKDHIHRCWVRHGEIPLLTVDKKGDTCSAGAGSFLSPRGWHGFLRNGELVE